MIEISEVLYPGLFLKFPKSLIDGSVGPSKLQVQKYYTSKFHIFSGFNIWVERRN